MDSDSDEMMLCTEIELVSLLGLSELARLLGLPDYL